jgi:hypothetical protein
LIWVVQLIHYPAFAVVAAERFTDFHAGHSRRISWIVGPPMLAELGSAIVLFWLAQNWWWGLNLVSVGAIWLSTAFALVPLHTALGKGQEPALIRRMVRANWVRTILWSLRSAALFYVLTLVLSGYAPGP